MTSLADAVSPPDDKRPRRLFRFSLLTMVLLTTIIGLVITVVLQQAKLAPMEAENKRMRNELGIFKIEDPEKIHVIRVPTEDNAPRKYRVYLPPGRKYVRCYRGYDIPEQEIPEQTNIEVLEPGNYLFTVKAERFVNKETGEPEPIAIFRIRSESTDQEPFGNSSATVSISERGVDWIVNEETGNMAYSWQEPGRDLELHDATEPLVLYRARANKVKVLGRRADGHVNSWSSEMIPGETEGFMMWVEPEQRRAQP
ncbi:hypothetical protein [Aeoliella mucimassa]|uniref:Uncharacterized protein n=1 Tax=Aeoliella mucimassa TaxID=2527972 RepID=A0A518AR07_9BACT|nr:hypothetical protein [Aeoliella mucimassa]QDU57146.1 hypothetical protein Pan181_33600 [Aeoliella mucimassa]